MKTVSNVYKAGLCCSCGMCVGVCPVNAVSYGRNVEGLLKPTINKLLCVNCGACVKNCPGAHYFGTNSSMNEKLDVEKVLCSYVIHSSDPEIRSNSSSGGFVTELLCFLLDERVVDYCIVIPPVKNSLRIMPEITADKAKIRQAKGSKYIPTEYGSVLKEIKTSKNRYALVALPCQTLFIQNYLKEQLDRIYIITLMCNHVTGSTGTKMVLGKYGANKQYAYDYRGNGWPGFVAIDGVRVCSHMDIYGGLFGRFFYPLRCRMCKNHIGKDAGIVVADNYCWDENGEGNSLVMIREPQFIRIVNQMSKMGYIEISPIDLIHNQQNYMRQFKSIEISTNFAGIIVSARKALRLPVPENVQTVEKSTIQVLKDVAMYLSVVREKIKSILYSYFVAIHYWRIK